MPKKVTPHIENYLETIYLLGKEHGHAHVKDVARRLRVKMPSVTEAVRKLREARLVNYQKYGFVTLSQKGTRLAQSVYRRHKVLYEFLRKVLGVDKVIAEEEACKIEHVISSITLRKLSKFIEYQEI
jgi:DtxR family Mn-dependent transcriptional regulator